LRSSSGQTFFSLSGQTFSVVTFRDDLAARAIQNRRRRFIENFFSKNVSGPFHARQILRKKEMFFFCVSDPFCLSPSWPSIFFISLYGSTTLLTGMTGISLHMKWPPTDKKHSF
jgi:hypothetical protein